MSCGHIFHWANESLCLLAQGGQNVANWVILCPQTVGRRAWRASLALFARSCSRPRQLVRWRLLVNKRGPVSGHGSISFPRHLSVFHIPNKHNVWWQVWW